jgi:hypothetical protein
MNQDEPLEFIRKSYSKKDVYGHWLKHLRIIEDLTKHEDNYDYAMSIGYLLFPLIEAISWTLFNKSGREYLEKLGVKKSYLVYQIFRNGQLHNIDNYILKYDDGEISWGMSSGGGSGGITPYDPGFVDKKFPEYNKPAENVFEYIQLENGIAHASLSLDRLAALIRYDLEQRLTSDLRDTIELIVGQKVKGKRPSVNPKR